MSVNLIERSNNCLSPFIPELLWPLRRLYSTRLYQPRITSFFYFSMFCSMTTVSHAEPSCDGGRMVYNGRKWQSSSQKYRLCYDCQLLCRFNTCSYCSDYFALYCYAIYTNEYYLNLKMEQKKSVPPHFLTMPECSSHGLSSWKS